jgi:hypothetical protein
MYNDQERIELANKADTAIRWLKHNIIAEGVERAKTKDKQEERIRKYIRYLEDALYKKRNHIG